MTPTEMDHQAGGRAMLITELPPDIGHRVRDLASDMGVPQEWVVRAVFKLGTADELSLVLAVEAEAERCRVAIGGAK
jgi:hypothetical protein